MGTIEALRKSLDVSEHFVKKNLPTIITIASSGGVAGSVYLMAKEAPRAAEKVKEKKLLDPNFSKAQTVAVYCEECWPSLTLAGVSIAGMNYANHKQIVRIAEIGAAYSLVVSDNKTKDKIIETKDKVIESLKDIVGEDKVEEAKEKLGVSSKSKSAYQTEVENIEPKVFGKNEIRPCRLVFTGQEFKNSMNGLTKGLEYCKAALDPSPNIYGNKVDKVDYLPLSEVQYQIKCSQSESGDLLGWAAGDYFGYSIAVADIRGNVGYDVYLHGQPTFGFDMINEK